MMISTQHLDNQACDDLSKLVAACRTVDGNVIATYPDLLNQHRPKPCSLLYYVEHHLVGFASAFFFEQNAIEVSLLVAPNHRRQGIAQQLFHELLAQVHATHLVETITMSTPQATYSTLLKNHGFHYRNSEYDMHRQSNTLFDTDPNTVIRLATHDDIERLCMIDEACFASENPYSMVRFNTLLERPKHHIFLILHQHEIVGKAHLAWQHNEQAHLSDIAVVPSMQRMGFGKKLITHCINHAITHLSRTIITLSVEANNQHALHLYENLGFSITNVMDYWQAPFPEQYLRSINSSHKPTS